MSPSPPPSPTRGEGDREVTAHLRPEVHWEEGTEVDPFGGAKPRLLRRGKEAPLRVNPEQAQAFRPGSRRVDFS